FLGFGPLWGTGVTSLIDVMAIPFDTKPRMEDSRPEPTPLTTTATSFKPMVWALPPTVSPTLAAAKGVPFLAPLKPSEPLEDQAKLLPLGSVSTAFVLL